MVDNCTPMMGQYRRIRQELPQDTILFFRLGDFYEMFFEDAKTAAAVLDIALTKRNGIPMCGVPYHASQMYLAKLIKAGKRVAICDQVEEATAGKIVRREISRIVTPGTVLDEGLLEARSNNYLAGICPGKERIGWALLDLSTGDLALEELSSEAALHDNLWRYCPVECLLPQERGIADIGALKNSRTLLTQREDWIFAPDVANDFLCRHFGVHSLAGFGCGDGKASIGAAGALLYYVSQELKQQVSHVRRIRVVRSADYMLLDEATVANLELIESRSSATLLKALDATNTPMGARLLRSWILAPLTNLGEIQGRHDAVASFFSDGLLRADTRALFSQVKDLERLIARISSGSGNARDVRALAVSLKSLPEIKNVLANTSLRSYAEAIEPLPEVVAEVECALVDEPPLPLKEGGIIRPGYSDELDELRSAATDGKEWMANFQAAEQERTGIKSLKVRYNKVFGYYIEITNSNIASVPADYVRKQTMANAERYITPQLKDYENKILGAQDRSCALEYELFLHLREYVAQRTEAIQRTAMTLAQLDVFAALAEIASNYGYVRPTMNDSGRVVVKDGRHPVVEQLPDGERFVPNDTLLDRDENQLIIITGPNMAGKSTYIRQVALIVIMAQIGSFVPAKAAEIGVTDRVFTRIGASDDLARGRSTFMVEMQETANILNNATARSLIVLDEIGRGTSTFDGISIAWAVAEYLHNNEQVKAKTLFATHYHELTDLALTMRGVKNYSVLVRETGERIVFLRRIVPGVADKSYGIHVAQLAGLPRLVVDRAKKYWPIWKKAN